MKTWLVSSVCANSQAKNVEQRVYSCRCRPRIAAAIKPAMKELLPLLCCCTLHGSTALSSPANLLSDFDPHRQQANSYIHTNTHIRVLFQKNEKQVRCEAGYFCRDAARNPCPAGTYGASTGLRDEGCSGSCPAGSSCAEGTVVPSLCEEGFYAVGGAVACNACPGKRAAGFEGERCRTSRSCCG